MQLVRDWWARTVAVVILASCACATSANAEPFGFIGARQVGMGGAGVASTEDAQGVYWNPAGLVLQDGLDIRLSGGVRATVNTNLDNAINKVKQAINSGDSSQEVIDFINGKLSSLSDSASGGTNGGGGIFAKYSWDDNAVGLAFYDVFNGTA